MLKSLNETLPSQIKIKRIILCDSNEGKETSKNVQLLFENSNNDFKTLCFHNNKSLEMTCQCCLTDNSFNQLRQIDIPSEEFGIQFYLEVKNQFNIITEINLRANYKIQNIKEEKNSKYINLKLLSEFSNITETYEEQSY